MHPSGADRDAGGHGRKVSGENTARRPMPGLSAHQAQDGGAISATGAYLYKPTQYRRREDPLRRARQRGAINYTPSTVIPPSPQPQGTTALCRSSETFDSNPLLLAFCHRPPFAVSLITRGKNKKDGVRFARAVFFASCSECGRGEATVRAEC